MNITKILNRIAYVGPLDVNLKVLSNLQHAYLYNVPFENLDIHTNVKIILDTNLFYEKIVNNNRGGFCYESNALFYELLKEIGFDVSIIAARMMINNGISPGYSHMALLVKLEEDYLVDVGNGQSVRDPMPIPGEVISQSEGIRYKVGVYGNNEFALFYRTDDSEWNPRFVFSTARRHLEEFKVMCHYHQTSSDSVFTKQRLCTLPTAKGRLTLTNDTFTINDDGEETKETIDSKEKMVEILQKYFNINVQISG
ncbi:MAG: arylamine N-acetyltransferase family protein [Gammaproteobacteria bacterium]